MNRYHFPEHPKGDEFARLNARYLELSEQHREAIEKYKYDMLHKDDKDQEFIERLKKAE